MSYVVLARKYRPKNFAEMVGQEHVVQALGNALATQRLHHAYLFTGTRGVGKTTVSRILAKSLNCVGPDGQGGITAEPCGVCQACRDIDAGRFVDYTELDAASNRSVDEVQALLEQAVYKPVQGRFKVFMIDEVHMLTNTAFNAMLKTLEEPPEYLKFVLATTDPQKVPVTVLSRCLQFNLRPMAPDTVLEHLTRVLAAEEVPAEVAALRLLARAARGSMRDALSLTDQAIAFGNGQLQEATVRQMLGAVDSGHVWALIEALATGDGQTVVQTVDTLRFNGFSAVAALDDMTGALQRMAVVQAVPSLATATDPEQTEIARLAALLPPDATQLLYSLCLHGRAELGLAPDEYAGLTMVLLRLLAFRPPGVAGSATPPAPEKKTLNIESMVPVAPALTPAPAVQPAPARMATLAAAPPVVSAVAPAAWAPVPAPVVASPPFAAAPVPVASAPVVPSAPVPDAAARTADASGAADDGAERWYALVASLVQAGAITALVRELALQSQWVAAQGDTWYLRVAAESLMQPSTRDGLQKALQQAGHAVRLQLEQGPVSDSQARRQVAAGQARQRAAEDAAAQDPLVQALLRDFGGKMVPGSIQSV
ncbi:DNA polymerase III subunit gamma/tau [Macromonas bipunctata]|uniref:DNA polymerase III subunit gamma/tau n=1 Tax=Macromonas bipunctata TaxID=183670 RepID=UPI000C33C364|nr:DNA polymerase III subunit gamma/tau [Macromonas bipunctata]